MTIPSSVKIGPIDWAVVVDAVEWMKAENEKRVSTDAYGYTEYLSGKLYLNPEQQPQIQRMTLLHEILHAAAETVMGCPDWANLGEDVASREEAVIRAWESPILCVLRDNPDLVAYLTQAD